MSAHSRHHCAHLREPSTTAEIITHHHHEAADTALEKAKGAIEKSAVKPLKAISMSKFLLPLTNAEWTMLDRLLQSGDAWGDLSLANPQTRFRVQHALIHGLLNHFDDVFAQPQCRTFLATFAWDAGMTSRDAPVIPIESMRRTVHRTLRGLCLSGIGNFEFDVLRRKLPDEGFRRISAHAHVICWSTDRAFQPEANAKRLSASPRFPNMLGISAVDIVSRARSEVRRGFEPRESPELDQTPRSIGHLGHYITKAKFCSLNRLPVGSKRSRPKLLPDEDHFAAGDALRLADINSRFSPEKTLLAFGQGNAIKQSYRRIFRSTGTARKARHTELKADVIEQAFEKVWAARNCRPTEIF